METRNPLRHERPTGLAFASVVMSVFNVAGVLFYQPIEEVPAQASVAFFVVFYIIVAGVSFVVIWFFWRGLNWARWLVLATSVLALLNLLAIPTFNRPAQVLIVAEAAFAVWLLYWLNTQDVVRFFRRRMVAEAG